MALFSGTVTKMTEKPTPTVGDLFTLAANQYKAFDTQSPMFGGIEPATATNQNSACRVYWNGQIYELSETFAAVVASTGAGVADLEEGRVHGIYTFSAALVSGTITGTIDPTATLANLNGKTAVMGHLYRSTPGGTVGTELTYSFNTSNARVTVTSKDVAGATETADGSTVTGQIIVINNPA